MAPGEPLIRLRHGTTKQRAEAILKEGPKPNFREPGGLDTAEGFSTARLTGPYPTGSPEKAATGKACLFPNEGGAVFLEIEVPEAIVRQADLVGEVRFEYGFGMEELLAAWPSLVKRIIPL
jgi:hypothetical protein